MCPLDSAVAGLVVSFCMKIRSGRLIEASEAGAELEIALRTYPWQHFQSSTFTLTCQSFTTMINTMMTWRLMCISQRG